jgi:XcyI restriction endonuclease
MSNIANFPVLVPDLQIGFYQRLVAAESKYLYRALEEAREKLKISDLDKALLRVAGEDGLKLAAKYSLRGELVFATSEILVSNPYLLAYYRLLLGFSQKEFFSKGPFGTFKSLEESGKISPSQKAKLDDLCRSLSQSSILLLRGVGAFKHENIHSLQLLTLGPQLRGSRNNVIGQAATFEVFEIVKKLVKKYIVESNSHCIKIENTSGRIVTIRFASDPDIEIEEVLSNGIRGLISIEIKGGSDISNIHNRIGEAEKSHQKAKKRGYHEFMTILNVDIDHATLKQESPTTSHFFDLAKLKNKSSKEFVKFAELLSSIISIRLEKTARN